MSVEARKRLFTVEEFHRMGEAGILEDDARLELVGGEIFEMPPIRPGHAGGVGFLIDALARVLTSRAIVWVQNPIVLDDFSEPLPDIALLRPREDFYRNEHPRAGDVLHLIEVADSSTRRDRNEKLPRYAAAGIPELWLADLPAGRVEVHREPSGDRYEVVSVYTRGQSVSPAAFPDVVLKVDDILG